MSFRTKESIMSDAQKMGGDGIQKLILETLLDIREGLSTPQSVVNVAPYIDNSKPKRGRPKNESNPSNP